MTFFWLFAAAVAIVLGFHLFTQLQLSRLRRTGLYPPVGQASMADVERFLKSGLRVWAVRCYRKMQRCSLRQAKEAVESLPANPGTPTTQNASTMMPMSHFNAMLAARVAAALLCLAVGAAAAAEETAAEALVGTVRIANVATTVQPAASTPAVPVLTRPLAPVSWLDARQQPKPVAHAAVKLLLDAETEGLNPADYAASQLQQALASGRPPLTPGQAAALNAQLSGQMTRYLADLRNGRIDPKQIRENYQGSAATQPFDAAQTLRSALEAGDMGSAVAAATPHAPMYAELRAELSRYRQAVASGLWAQQAASAAVADGLPPLPVQRLVALGDMPQAMSEPGIPGGQAALQEAVRGFQLRHGLRQTGKLDKATLAELAVSPAERAGRIALAMERQRWTPLLQGTRIIKINVPEYALRAYAKQDNGQLAEKVQMRVIVGKARDNRTPLFDRDMLYIEFSPYWNVPPSIARKELIPKIQADPSYLARNNYEIVGTNGVEGVRNGTARIRQKPGRGNALGDIKFVFPNADNIYLHHTSSPGLFNRTRRDLSHGCVRVEAPVQLAQFVLQETPGWTEDRIRKAMQRGQSSTVRLAEPVPVLITYSTTVVRDGRVHFLQDIYGQDAVLAKALRERKPDAPAIAPRSVPATAPMPVTAEDSDPRIGQ